MLHGAQSPSHSLSPGPPAAQVRRMKRKRKAESQDNERLSKRLSLLNIGMFDDQRAYLTGEADIPVEQNGSKLYVPVEAPSIDANTPASSKKKQNGPSDDTMQLDDSKHKVYIYNIDDELSSSDSECDEGKLVFLPDIEKHLRANRIPQSILANDEGEIAGMQLVLYSDPKSLTVSEDKDSVRKAIIESRHRVREQQRLEREGRNSTPITSNASMNTQATMAPNTTFQGHEPDEMELD